MVKQQEDRRKEFYNEYNRKLKLVLDAKGLSNAAMRDNFKPIAPIHDYASVEKEESIFKNTTLQAIKIEELSWSDRERVLRLLFAKMNGIVHSNSNHASDEVEKAYQERSNTNEVTVREGVLLPAIQ